MFFFAARVNLALISLGVPPNILNKGYKAGLLAFGKMSGNSPQEIALYAVAQLPVVYRINLNVGMIKGWIRRRKINPDAPEMQEALGELGLSGLL
jgi:hypothetical protein